MNKIQTVKAEASQRRIYVRPQLAKGPALANVTAAIKISKDV